MTDFSCPKGTSVSTLTLQRWRRSEANLHVIPLHCNLPAVSYLKWRRSEYMRFLHKVSIWNFWENKVVMHTVSSWAILIILCLKRGALKWSLCLHKWSDQYFSLVHSGGNINSFSGLSVLPIYRLFKMSNLMLNSENLMLHQVLPYYTKKTPPLDSLVCSCMMR